MLSTTADQAIYDAQKTAFSSPGMTSRLFKMFKQLRMRDVSSGDGLTAAKRIDAVLAERR
jgi:hypothetical protein